MADGSKLSQVTAACVFCCLFVGLFRCSQPPASPASCSLLSLQLKLKLQPASTSPLPPPPHQTLQVFHVPAVIPQLSSQQVLTTEWVNGVTIDKVCEGATGWPSLAQLRHR